MRHAEFSLFRVFRFGGFNWAVATVSANCPSLLKLILYGLICSVCLCRPTHALDWSSTDIQYLHGGGYLLGSAERDIVTVEHASGWQYGQNYLFVDTIHHRDGQDPVSWEAYGEAYAYLSAGKIFASSFAFGSVKDIGMTFGFNAGSQPVAAPFRAYLAGGSLQFDWPVFQFLQIDLLAYRNERLASTAFQVTPSWELPFSIAGAQFRFRGFMDYIAAGGAGPAETILFQPQLLLDVGTYAGGANHFLLGFEYQYWHNKFGLAGIEESLPQALMMLRY